MELKDCLREIIEEYVDPGCEDECVARILSLPDIKAALEWWAVFKHAEPLEVATTSGVKRGLVLPRNF